MMKLYEFTDDISDEDRLARMHQYLDEMTRLTEELVEHNKLTGNVYVPDEHRAKNT